jgi:hypothetical protein
MLGYGRATSGGDPTPSRESRHLVVLRTAMGVTLHIQIGHDALNSFSRSCRPPLRLCVTRSSSFLLTPRGETPTLL